MSDAYVDSFTHLGPDSSTRSLLDHVEAAPGSARWIGGVGATLLHAVLVAAAWSLAASASSPVMRAPASITQLMEVPVELTPPAPEPVAPSAPAPPESKPALTPSEPAVRAAPAAARAAQVLSEAAPAEEIVDFGAAFVQGTGVTYAGGVSAATGSSERAVRDGAARPLGIVGGSGTDERGVDRSRAPALAGGATWDCPFPREAQFAGVDQALVTLSVRVSAQGSVEHVDVEDDPGNGFGREARRCAMHKRWAPGRDPAGNPAAMTSRVNVRFVRAN